MFDRKCMAGCVRRKDSLLLIEGNKMRDSREGGATEYFNVILNEGSQRPDCRKTENKF